MDSSSAIDPAQVVELLKPPRDVYRVCGPVPGTVPELARRIVWLLDDGAPLNRACREVGIPLAKGRAVVDRLKRLGVITVEVPRLVDRAPEAPFDEVEESFFESEVPPIDECDEPFVGIRDRMRSFLGRLSRR